MSHRTAFQLGAALALILSATLGGSNASAAEPSSAVIARHDTDSDKTLDWNEVQTAASGRLDRLNKDSDGTLDAQEVKGIIGAAALKAVDPDNDGTLDAKELSSKAGRRLKLLIG